MTIEGDGDTEVFQNYVRELLCSPLRPGDPVVMNNFSPDKQDPTLRLIEQTGASIRFLPANPLQSLRVGEALP